MEPAAQPVPSYLMSNCGATRLYWKFSYFTSNVPPALYPHVPAPSQLGIVTKFGVYTPFPLPSVKTVQVISSLLLKCSAGSEARFCELLKALFNTLPSAAPLP